jgi:hypothetical protein
MVKMPLPLLNVRGQPLSDRSFVCVLTFFGFGASGSDFFGLGASGRDCCALAALQGRENRKIRAQMTDAAKSIACLLVNACPCVG